MSSEALYRTLGKLLGLYLATDAVLRAIQLPMTYVAFMNSDTALLEKTGFYLLFSSFGLVLMFSVGVALLRHFRVSTNDESGAASTTWPDVALVALRLIAIYFIAIGFVDGFKALANTIFSENYPFLRHQWSQVIASFGGGWGLLLFAKPLSRFVTKI